MDKTRRSDSSAPVAARRGQPNPRVEGIRGIEAPVKLDEPRRRPVEMPHVVLRGITGASAIEPTLEALPDHCDVGRPPHEIIEVKDVAEEVPIANGRVHLRSQGLR